MHRERRDRVEKERQDRLDALEKELVAKQQRAERLRQERLQSRKCNITRFSRRPLGPESNAHECSQNASSTGFKSRQDTQPSHTMPSMMFETRRPMKRMDTEPQELTTSEVFGRLEVSRESDGQALTNPESAAEQARPRSNSQRVKSRWHKYLPASVKSSLIHDENLMRSLTTPQLLSRPNSANAAAAENTARGPKGTARTYGDDQTSPPDDIWTGRGLIVDEAELRKKSIFDSPDHSSDSSSRGSYALIQPKATSLEPQSIQMQNESLSQTPLPQTNLLVPVYTTSPRLSTLTEHCLLVTNAQSATPQQLAASDQRRQTKPSRVFASIPPNSSRYTPIYPNATPSSFVSPPGTFVPMAPKRRGNVGRAAILQGIATGSAQFVDAVAKRYGDELNSIIPIPPRLIHLFNYNSTACANPLTIAVKASSSELVRGFIEAEADVFITDSGGRTLLHQIFLPLPSKIELLDAENWPQPFRLPEMPRPNFTLMPSPRSSVLQTPRINEQEQHFVSRGSPGRCRLIEAAQTPWLTNMDNRATIVELLVCAGLSPSVRDADGKYASDYAREWLWQAHRELEDPDTSFTDKISACCVRATCLSLLTLEDYLRLSYLAPLTTNYKVRKLMKPRLDFEVEGRHVMISSSMLKDNCTPERILPIVRGKCATRVSRPRKSMMSRPTADPLVLFLSFARRHKDHPGPLRILEFLGAGFVDTELSGDIES